MSYIKGYYLSYKSFYNRNDEYNDINIGMYDESDDSCLYEFCIDFDTTFPRISIYSDAIQCVKDFSELFENFNMEMSRDGVEQLLKNLGYKDLTNYERPKKL